MRATTGRWVRYATASTAGCVVVVLAAWPAAARAQQDVPEIVVRAPWGSAVGDLGRRGGDESAPEGPMSFAVTAEWDVWVLDQVNRRIVRYGAGGSVVDLLPVDLDTYQALAVAPGGELVLMDRLAAGIVRVIDPAGALLGEAPLVGPGIEEGGGTTALFAREDGIWVEYDHRRSVRVLDAGFREPAQRRVLPVRPLDAGTAAGHARLAGPASVEVWTTDPAGDAVTAQRTIGFDEQVARIVTLASDDRGDIVLAVHLMTEDPARGFAVVHEALVVLVLDPALALRRRIVTAPSVGAWEQFEEFEVTADGAIWQMAFVEEGVEVRRWLP